jgi:hypothetical protein
MVASVGNLVIYASRPAYRHPNAGHSKLPRAVTSQKENWGCRLPCIEKLLCRLERRFRGSAAVCPSRPVSA